MSKKWEDYSSSERKIVKIVGFGMLAVIGLIIIGSLAVNPPAESVLQQQEVVAEPTQTDLAKRVDENIKSGYMIESYADLKAQDEGYKFGHITEIKDVSDGTIEVFFGKAFSDEDEKQIAKNVLSNTGTEITDLQKVIVNDGDGKEVSAIRSEIPMFR